MKHLNAQCGTHLEALAAKYGTDKLQHGYIPFYEKHLPKEPKRILEIGVKEGRSLMMWSEYFPDAEIHGLDLFSSPTEEEVNCYLGEQIEKLQLEFAASIHLHKGNQCDWKLLEELRKYDFDVIIDDGSHNSRDQLITYFGLFNGKHYFIEDLHCCGEEFYRQGLSESFSASSLFSDVAVANHGTIYEGDIVFNDKLINEPRKIVCIKDLH